MKYFVFDVTLGGYGNSPEEAWEQIVESFNDCFDSACTPSVLREIEVVEGMGRVAE
jgi:tRNA A-37 threonylcarbamoyl transferase component Bud32